jgi:hypothetical protein
MSDIGPIGASLKLPESTEWNGEMKQKRPPRQEQLKGRVPKMPPTASQELEAA